MGWNVKLDGSVAVIVITGVIVTPYSVPPLTGFVGLQWAEARLIMRYKTDVCNIPLLNSEERKYIVWLQQLMYRKIHDIYIYIYIYISIDER